MVRRVRERTVGDGIRLAVYTVGVPVSALGLSPVFYQGGKALAEVAQARAANRVLEWLARVADDADFHGVFVIAFLLLALVMLLPLHDATGGRVFRSIGMGSGRRMVSRGGWFFTAAVMGGLLVPVGLWGAGLWRFAAGFAMMPVLGAVLSAVVAAFVFEWFFRGVMHGVVERGGVRWFAVLLVPAVVFTGYRLLFLPLPGGEFGFVRNESWFLGWEMVGIMSARLLDPVVFVAVVLPVFGWGVLLGVVRRATGGIWLPSCMHAGWLCADRVFAMGSTDVGSGPVWICWCALGVSILMWVIRNPRDARDV